MGKVYQNAGLHQLHIFISGQIMGGKNHVIVCRNGRRIPNKSWAKWRDAKVKEVAGCLPCGWTPISSYAAVHMNYVAGDKRRRDQPATIDAIWHVLEKAGVVSDDTHLWVEKSTRSYNKEEPGVHLTIIYRR